MSEIWRSALGVLPSPTSSVLALRVWGGVGGGGGFFAFFRQIAPPPLTPPHGHPALHAARGPGRGRGTHRVAARTSPYAIALSGGAEASLWGGTRPSNGEFSRLGTRREVQQRLFTSLFAAAALLFAAPSAAEVLLTDRQGRAANDCGCRSKFYCPQPKFRPFPVCPSQCSLDEAC